ncbi:MAG: two-component system unclassified family response regulator [Bacteroidetes bacterium]|nr:MAG: two-component system unclassified family response regulator [Bacteroidota bacterium]
MPELLKVLLIDDNPDDRILVIRELKKLFIIDVDEIIDSNEFERSLERLDFDIVITDYQLRWTTGIEVLIKIKTINPLLPVIMFTGTGSEEIAVMAMKVGLDDYILKSPQHYVRLAMSVNSVILRMKEEMLRKQTQNALRKSEESYRLLVENIEIGFTRVDKDFNITMVNEAQCKLFNLKAEDLIGKKCYELYNTSLLQCPCVFNFKDEPGVKSRESLTQGRRKDKSTFEAHLRTFPTRNEKGEVTGYIEITEDITGRIRSERIQEVSYNIANTMMEADDLNELILRIKSELSKVIDTSDFNIFLCDESDDQFKTIYGAGTVQVANSKDSPTLEGIVIQTQNPLIVKQQEITEMLEQSIIEDCNPDIRVWIGVPLKSGKKIIGILVLQNFVNENALSASDLDILKFVSNQIGIAIENRRATDNLKESELKFRSIIEQSSEGFVLVDNEGNITEWNQAASNLLMISHEEAVGRKVWEIHSELIEHSDDKAPDISELVEMYNSRLIYLRKHGSFLNSYSVLPKDGIPRVIQITFFLTKIKEKEYFSVFLRDLSDRN